MPVQDSHPCPAHDARALSATWSIDGPHVVVALRGEVDLANASAVPPVIAGALGTSASVRVDLADVSFLDSTVLRVLVVTEERLRKAGIDLKLRNPTRQAHRVLEVTGLAARLLELPAELPDRSHASLSSAA